MGWKEFLKGILPTKIASDNKILDNVEELKLASDNKIEANSNTKTQNNTFNGPVLILNNADEKSVDKVLSALKLDAIPEGTELIAAPTTQRLNEIDKTFWSETVQAKIKELSPIVPSRDKHILEESIFLQEEYDQGIRVSEYTRDLAIRYGRRGNSICHLYSAGYFNDILLPAYKELIENDNPQFEEYKDIYELVVDESLLAIFIGQRHKQKDIIDMIISKIEANQKAGFYNFNIHGIGKTNKMAILKALKNERIKKFLEGEPVVESKNKMHTVTIFFKETNTNELAK